MKNLYKKEINYYLSNPIGYLVLILFGVFANFLFIKDIFIVGSASMRGFFGIVPWLLMVFIPALAMRVLSEEKRVNTIEVLLTLPFSETEIVLSKFFALLVLAVIGLFLTMSLPISLSFLSKVYLPEIFIGYLGLVFLAGSFISIGVFFSNLTKNQVVAFLSSILLIFFLLVLSTDYFANVLPKFLNDVLIYFSPIFHLQNFVKGVIDLRSVFYFTSLTLVFLFLTIISLEKRK
ncbi:MAG: ABC transporter permease subunit [Patescibacteria group bacterium]|nr:ABC transporter permease subunit [Patescibacteria group bacterium]